MLLLTDSSTRYRKTSSILLNDDQTVLFDLQGRLIISLGGVVRDEHLTFEIDRDWLIERSGLTFSKLVVILQVLLEEVEGNNNPI